MKPANYEYQSEFARRYFFQGKAEGKAELLIELATVKFGQLSEGAQGRILSSSAAELGRMGERLLGATTIDEVLNAS
jgi:hypothetical protein